MDELSITTRYSGIYKLNFPNQKVYIGLSNHFYRRMLEHNTDFRNGLPIEYAIQKYGPIKEFEVLEFIPPNNRSLMKEREQYWIKFYDSTNKSKGYNVSIGGDGANSGSNNPQARLTEEELFDLYDDLKYNLYISLQELANNYNLNISSISRINNGITYYHEDIKYPIRNPKDCKKIISGTNNRNSHISEMQLYEIYEALQQNVDKPLKMLAQDFGISTTIIQNINLGKTYHNDNLIYPLWKPLTGSKKLNNEDIKNIIHDITMEPAMSLAAIGRKYNCSAKTISGINCGTIYKQKNITYPIRNKQKAVSTISASGE